MDVGIISLRNVENWPSFHLVYEWENQLKSEFECELFNVGVLSEVLNKLSKTLQKSFSPFKLSNKIWLYFEMFAATDNSIYNVNNVIPIIIDFYLKEKDLKRFYEGHKNNKVVLISSAEVYRFLKDHNCPLNIIHYPLSLPDKYIISQENNVPKCWDLILAGRQSPVFEKYVEQYSAKYPDFTYVYRTIIDDKFLYYTNKGECLGEFESRDGYWSLMRRSRIGLYTTPGVDGGHVRTNGFSQVTPRFLELLASRCHILSRYIDNDDTEYYRIGDYSLKIDSYEQFESSLNSLLENEVNEEYVAEYLSKHYTSARYDIIKRVILECQNLPI